MTQPTRRTHWPAWAALATLAVLTLAACALPTTARRNAVSGPVGQLAVDDGGSSANGTLPVLFVHSFAGSTLHWQKQLQHLRSSRRAVAMDLRGNGRSEAPRNNDYAIASFADDIAAVADGLGLQRFVLVGHSMGGSAAAAYARQNPRRVAGLVLVTTPGKTSAEEAQKVMASLDADYTKVMAGYWETLVKDARPEVRSMLESDMRKLQREPAKAMIAATFAYDPLPALTSYTGPLLLIDTERGDSPNALYRQLRKTPRDVIGGTSHWPQLDDPERFNALLDAFLLHVR